METSARPWVRLLSVCSTQARTAMFLGFTFMFGMVTSTAAQPQNPVFRAWQPESASALTKPDGQVGLRVAVQFDLLTRGRSPGDVLELVLADNLTVRVRAVTVQGSATQTFIAGPLVDGRTGEASLMIVGGTLAGRIVVDGRLFVVRRISTSATHLITEVDPRTLPPEGAPIVPPRTRTSTPPDPQVSSDTNQFVDVMIVYTPAARAAAGGSPQIAALIAAAVGNANNALGNAGVFPRFRLVYYGEVTYTETNNSVTDLGRLQSISDGYLDEVHSLRDLYGADTVSLLTTDTDACGVGYLMTAGAVDASFASYAFNVVLWSCANANLSFAHETGHNIGLHHDRANAGSGAPSYPYAYGYAVPGLARDVMSYACAVSCPRVAIYSTPLHSFPGTTTPAGTATEDNARALTNTSAVVADFRQAPPVLRTPVVSTVRDYDGDGKPDITIFRNSNGGWFVRRSSSGGLLQVYWGAPSLQDQPVPADYDGDGKADIAVYRRTTGQWFIKQSSNDALVEIYWGAPSLDDLPVPGDYDGDGKADIAVYRASTGQWFIRRSSDNALMQVYWGAPSLGDIPVPADYDGDHKADIAVYRRLTGEWFVRRSSDSSLLQVGLGGIPMPADYDGDGKADIAVFRQSSAEWVVLQSSNGTPVHVYWGAPSLGDTPVPGDFDGDGKADIAVYRLSTGGWFIRRSSDSGLTNVAWGSPFLLDVVR